jgi:DNA-binding response OmpR family regulator
MTVTTDSPNQPRILIVDDDIAFRKMIATIIKPMGVEIGEAADGKQGIEMIEAAAWDVVILDLNMPVMDGFQTLEKIRQMYPMEKLPVLLVSGQDDAEARLKALHMHANEFLGKPLDRAELVARLGIVLELRRAYAAIEAQVRELRRVKTFREAAINIFIHDLRNALTGVKAYVDLARESMLDKDDWIATHLEKAVEAIDRIAGMASDAMDAARLEDGRLKPKLGVMGMDAIIKNRMEVALQLARRKDVVVTADLEKDAPPVRVDPIMIERMLENLLTTALRNTPEGGKMNIIAGYEAVKGMLAVKVEHTGWRPKTPWKRSSFDGNAQVELGRQGYNTGTGLGLDFCRLAMACQGGTMWFEGGPDMNAAFILQIPTAVAVGAGV